jgi:Undecaprenyl-phosphate galactose phosphotransferase WbaP
MGGAVATQSANDNPTDAGLRPDLNGGRFAEARLVSGISLLAADVVAFLSCLFVIFVIRMLIWTDLPFFWALWPAFAGWLVLRLALGLYPPFGMPQPEELRRSVQTAVLGGLVHAAMLVAAGELQGYRIIGLGVWVLVPSAAYFARSLAKSLLIRARLYGDPFVVVGSGEAARRAIREMRADPELGMVPAGTFGDPGQLGAKAVEGVPLLGPVEAAASHDFGHPVRNAMLALGPGEASRERVEALASDLSRRFTQVQILGGATMPGNMWTRPRPLGPYLALEVRQTRFSDRQRLAKRAFDIAVALPLLILAAPIIGVAALAVKAASPGPAFFTQTREGMGGQPIRIIKIRTMVVDAEKRLQEYFAVDPAARFEWERTMKLRRDPRIVPGIGNFLRRASIDELPQLINILRGDMSLVGPRIMPTHEVERYSEAGQQLRREVPPGLTGLWQVTSRNNSDLQVREIADSFYVSNWSVWMDGWILLRTVRVVLAGSGAY